MNVIRWEPFTAMSDLLNRFPAWFGPYPRLPGTIEGSSDWSPSVDISETDGEYLIRAALPGVRKEDAKVTYEDRSEEHTSELQSHVNLVCRLLLEKKKTHKYK